jgi:hypothetical protein
VDVRRRVVELALSVVSGAYQTSLLTYFIQRDLFPAIIKVRQPSLGQLALNTANLGTIVHTRYPSTSRDRRPLHTRRNAGELQQIRVPEPLSAANERLRQRGRNTKGDKRGRLRLSVPKIAVCGSPGRHARRLDNCEHSAQNWTWRSGTWTQATTKTRGLRCRDAEEDVFRAVRTITVS